MHAEIGLFQLTFNRPLPLPFQYFAECTSAKLCLILCTSSGLSIWFLSDVPFVKFNKINFVAKQKKYLYILVNHVSVLLIAAPSQYNIVSFFFQQGLLFHIIMSENTVGIPFNRR